MMRPFRSLLAGTALLALGACVAVPVEAPPPAAPPTPAAVPVDAPDFPRDARGTARAFVEVIQRMEPSIEEQCIRRRRGPINCDYQFVVVDDPQAEINAFQDLDSRGRPVIGFTLALIAATRNADELAFVIGHEASHHILDHLTQKSASARTGAVIFGALATATGADPVTVRSASQAGADFGARYYSKDWELQADYLGALVTLDAGFDPERGAQFFLRIPDPGNRILGTHPSRQQRLDAVGRAVGDKRAGRVD